VPIAYRLFLLEITILAPDATQLSNSILVITRTTEAYLDKDVNRNSSPGTRCSLLPVLKDAYTFTRYGHLEYNPRLVSELVSVARKLWSLLEEVERLATNMGEAGAEEA